MGRVLYPAIVGAGEKLRYEKPRKQVLERKREGKTTEERKSRTKK